MDTIGELQDMPLRQLRRKALTVIPFPSVREVLSNPNKALRCAARRHPVGVIMLCADLLMALVDDFVDRDKPSNHSPEWHMQHVQAVLDAISEGRHANLEVAPYDILLITMMRLAEHIGRPRLLELFRECWEPYCAHARWQLSNQTEMPQSIQEAAETSYAIVDVAFYYVMGGDLNRVRSLVERYHRVPYAIGRAHPPQLLDIRREWQAQGEAACREMAQAIPPGWRRAITRVWVEWRIRFFNRYFRRECTNAR